MRAAEGCICRHRRDPRPRCRREQRLMNDWQSTEVIASQLQAARLRRRLADAAAEIAATEEDLAATLDSLAATRPRDASRLRARARSAREYAAAERDRAATYGSPALPGAGPCW